MTDHLDATRRAYDIVAAAYAESQGEEVLRNPWHRAMLDVFVSLVGVGPVADLGCGPGQAAAYVHAAGVAVSGVDLSPATVEQARLAHPDIRFSVGSMLDLEIPDATLTGITAFYSIIHTPPAELPRVFAEFARTLAPGGHVLLAFQVGDERRHITSAYGHEVDAYAYRLSPDAIAALLATAGFEEVARLVTAQDETNSSAQAYLLARLPDL
jgi:SAM-dependent methyltransferase